MRQAQPQYDNRLLTIGLIALMLSWACAPSTSIAADAPSLEASRHTAAVFTYHGKETNLRPSEVFCGVVIDSRFIVTSAAALGKGHTSPFRPPAKKPNRTPSAVYAVVQAGGKQAVVQCEPDPKHNPESPLILLKVTEADEATLAQVVSQPFKASKLVAAPDTRAIGVFAPLGLGVDDLGGPFVPPPVSLSLQMRELTSIVDDKVSAATVGHALPDSFEGAGVWNDADQLTGIIARHDDRWYVLDPTTSAAILRAAEPAPQPIRPQPADTSPDKPDKPDPSPVTPDNPDKPDKPEATPPGLQPGRIALTKPSPEFLSLMKEFDLRMNVPPGLVDHVQQEQADMVMAYIAGGQLGEAMQTLDDIEPLVSGQLAEQLNYRRALALTLAGKYAEAKAKAQAAATAEDPLVAARGNLLNKVLTMNADGQFAGAPLSDPMTLTKAARDQLVETRRQLIGDLNALGSAADPAQLKDLRRRIKDASLAWPGYLDDVAKAAKQLDKSGTE